MKGKTWTYISPVLLLCSCSTAGPPPELLAATERRELTPVEKVSLTSALALTLKDPGSAQFKWVPVIMLEREGIFDYCGLVNGRNSYGGYVGFQKFYAQISKNDRGQFTKGLIRTVASDDVGTIATDGLCEKHGYADLSQAR
jgi:hypothetical protein